VSRDDESVSGDSETLYGSEDERSKTFNNINQAYPTIICTYLDPKTQKTRVVVIVCAPSGSATMHVEIPKNEPSTKHFVVTMPWADILVHPHKCLQVFEPSISDNDPQVIGFINALRNYRANIDEIPTASIKIQLPIAVQTDTESYEITGGYLQTGKNVGVQLLRINFQETQSEYTVKKSTTTITFE